MSLNDYKSKEPAIVGSTTINHAARVKLGLNCSEYVMMDHISRKTDQGTRADTLSVYIKTGFGYKETSVLLKSLLQKGFIMPEGDDFRPTQKWDDAFADIDKEFEHRFWRKDGKVVWTGTRKKALEFYVKVRKSHSVDFLVSQRDRYFDFLELQKKHRGFDQQKMMCQVFLNPQNERFNEDYADYVTQLKLKYEVDEVKPQPVTREQIMEQYGKDNNK